MVFVIGQQNGFHGSSFPKDPHPIARQAYAEGRSREPWSCRFLTCHDNAAGENIFDQIR
jgi:hypothetical protein